MLIDFDGVSKINDGGASASLGSGGTGAIYSYDTPGGDFGSWVYNTGNMGIDDAGAGLADGSGSGNQFSSLGQVRVQDWRGGNARAASVVFAASNFTDGVAYRVSFDVIGDPLGNDAGRFWLAELSGYDATGSNFIQIDGSANGWASQKPFTANGSASVSYLADSVDNGVSLTGENIAGTTTTTFDFTYSAFTDIGFSVGTFNNAFAIDNFEISVVPEPSAFSLIAGAMAMVSILRRRRK